MDVERRAGLQHVICRLEDLGKGPRLGEAPVGDGMQMGEIDDRADPAGPSGDREHVFGRPELPDAAHDLDPERHCTVLALEPLSQLAELLDDRVDRVRTLASEQKAWVEDDELGARRLGDPGRVVEHADGHALLLVALDVTHEARDRRVNGEHDSRLARKFPEALGPGVVHPELAFEVDLAGGVAALSEQLDRQLGTYSRWDTSRAELEDAHG